MKSNSKGSINIWSIVLVVVLLIVVGYVGYFKFIEKTVTDNEQTSPSITITSPNGGEVLGQNNAYVLSWNYEGLNDNDAITVGFRNADENVCWAGKTTASSRSYSFVPREVKCDGSIISLKSGGQFKAQLIVDQYADGEGVADISDNYFNISTQP